MLETLRGQDILTQSVVANLIVHLVLGFNFLLHLREQFVVLLHHLVAFVHHFAVLLLALEVLLQRQEEIVLTLRLLVGQIVVQLGLFGLEQVLEVLACRVEVASAADGVLTLRATIQLESGLATPDLARRSVCKAARRLLLGRVKLPLEAADASLLSLARTVVRVGISHVALLLQPRAVRGRQASLRLRRIEQAVGSLLVVAIYG